MLTTVRFASTRFALQAACKDTPASIFVAERRGWCRDSVRGQQHAGHRRVGSTVLPGARVTLVHHSRIKTPAQLSVWFCLKNIHNRRPPAVERRGRPTTSARAPPRHVFAVREIWSTRSTRVTLVHRSRMKTPVQLSVWFRLIYTYHRRPPAVEGRGRPATSACAPSRHVFE